MLYIYPPHIENAHITFLNVGQGDAVFFESKTGFQMLIDTGRGNSVLNELGKEMDLRDKEIDIVLITHPDSDHIGGLSSMLKRFSVRYLVVPDASDVDTFKDIIKEHTQIIVPPIPSQLVLSDDLSIEFLWGFDEDSISESNARALVVRIVNGEREVLLASDISSSIEKEIVRIYGKKIQSDILKLSHHGSKTSSDALFLQTVAPTDVVVSAGENNRYGHPHKEVIDRIKTFLPNTTIHYTYKNPVSFYF